MKSGGLFIVHFLFFHDTIASDMLGGKLYIVAIIQKYEIPIFFNLSHFKRVVLDKNCKYNIVWALHSIFL